MSYITTTMDNLIHQTAFFNLTWGNYLMIVVACVFLYLAIAKEFEPLLLLPIAFGMLLVNIYPDIMMHIEDSPNGTGGLLYYFYLSIIFIITTTIVIPKIAISPHAATILQINQECKNSTFATIIQNKKEDRAIRMTIKI